MRVCVCVCLPLPAPPTSHCVLSMFIAHQLKKWVVHAYMRQDCVRSLPEAPSTLHLTMYTVCVCVCLPLPAPPTPHCVLSMFIAHEFSYAYMCQDSDRFSAEAPSTLCIARDALCVCACVCHCLLPPPPLRPPDIHSPQIQFSGRATPTCVKVASDSLPRVHPPCVSRGTLCVCV